MKTLFWLQWKLTRAMFRSRRASDRLYVLELLLRLVMFGVTFPMFVAMGIGLAVALILLSPAAAYEAVMLVNTLLLFVWLILPASYNSQMLERFEMSRLFPHPISFRSIVVGSALMAMLTMTGLWTVPILAGEVVGLTWHQPLAFPLIALGALPTFALLALTGRIMEDFFDLVSGDRRLRTLAISLLMLPFMVCAFGQYIVQYATDNYSQLPDVFKGLEYLSEVSGPSEFLQALQPSRLLIWLPSGWTTAGMGLALKGEWMQALVFLALSILCVALLLWAHAGVTRRLMEGATLSIGVERVRSRKWLNLPGPQALWALFYKDWAYIWRNPMPRILILPMVLMSMALTLPFWGSGHTVSDIWPGAQDLSLLPVAFIIAMVSMAINFSLSADYFGVMDREGFATLALTGLDRRYIILSANLAVLLYAGGLYLVSLIGMALLTGMWIALPVGLYLGLCLQISGAPAYTLAAIIGPYRAQLKFSGGRQQGNLWGMLAWMISAPPILLLIVLPFIFFKPALLFTLPLSALYCLGLYALTLKPLAQLLQRREHAILEAVSTGD